jgi:GntR family transcriptional regulator, transcriptional repressor for pyruvate dehydrogenase complex
MAKDGTNAPFVEPIRAIRTYENAIEGILLGIEQAGLREGDPLPNETQLSAQLGISKPTLRQALRVLERAGLITVKRGKEGGIFLASDFLPHDGIIDQPAIDDRAAVNVLRARRAVETAVNLEALHAATDKDLDDIEHTIRLLNEPRIGTENILRADAMFHRAVARAAHNSVLDEALRGVYRHLGGLRHPQLRSSARRVRTIHTEHLAALRSRDPAALANALDTHFRFLEEAVAQSLHRPWEELFGDRAAPPSSGQKKN